MSLFDFLFGGPQKNPADAAMPALNKAEDALHEGYDPYKAMGEDPVAYLQKIMESYKPSSQYNLRNEEALSSAGNAAAAGGYRGTPYDQKNSAQITDKLLGDDMQQWLNNIFGVQDRGYQASTGLADNLSNVYGTKSQLAFQGQAQNNQNSSSGFSDLFKALAGLGGAGLSGGYF